MRCDFCRKRGHIARFCPEITFRISLTDSSIRPQKKEEKPPPRDRICELSRKKEGEGFVFFCGSQGCRKTFKNEFAYLQHLWSKCDTPGHPSREIAKRWSTDKPFVAVSGDPDHPDPQWVEKQQKELKEKMRKEIQDYEDEKSKKLRRAQGKEEESSSTESGSTDSEDDDEVSKTAKKVGIAVESFKRKSGVTEAGKRMLDQTLDEIVSQFLQSPSMMSQRIMIASWKLAKLVLVAAELIRT